MEYVMFRKILLVLANIGIVLLWGCGAPSTSTQRDKKPPSGSSTPTGVDMVKDKKNVKVAPRTSGVKKDLNNPSSPSISNVATPFNYDDWTADLPTRGQPKIPGPPYPYLNADGKKGIFDQLRKFRWDVWEYEQALTIEKEYLDKWLELERNISQETYDVFGSLSFISNAVFCGNWETPPHRAINQFPALTPDRDELEKLIAQYARLHPAAGTQTRLSFGNENLLLSDGGEVASRWLNKLKTVIVEITQLESSNRNGARQAQIHSHISRTTIYSFQH